MGSPEPTFSSSRLQRALNIFALWVSFAVSGLTSACSTVFVGTAGLCGGAGVAVDTLGLAVTGECAAGIVATGDTGATGTRSGDAGLEAGTGAGKGSAGGAGDGAGTTTAVARGTGCEAGVGVVTGVEGGLTGGTSMVSSSIKTPSTMASSIAGLASGSRDRAAFLFSHSENRPMLIDKTIRPSPEDSNRRCWSGVNAMCVTRPGNVEFLPARGGHAAKGWQ